jgi:hypothetical protein
MTDDRARRYVWLLYLYPRAHRRERGPEMLATLMEAAESGRGRSAGREVADLFIGALRTRTGAGVAVPQAQAWLSALRVAVLALLAQGTADSLARAVLVVEDLLRGAGLPGPHSLGYLAATVLGALALVAVAGGRHRIGALLAFGALGASQWAMALGLPLRLWLRMWPFLPEPWPFLLAALLTLALLVRGAAGARRPRAWLLAVPFALLLLPTAFDATLDWQPGALLVVVAGCLLWTVVDARVAVAGAAVLLARAVPMLCDDLFASRSGPAGLLQLSPVYLVLTVVLLGASVVRVRRQARL